MKFITDTLDQIVFDCNRPGSSVNHRYNFMKMRDGNFYIFRNSSIDGEEKERACICLIPEAFRALKDFLEIVPERHR